MSRNFIVLFLIVIFISSFSNLFGVVGLNDLEEVFPPSAPGESTSDNDIRSMMIDGASFFLESYAATNLLLKEFELAEKGAFNFEASNTNISNAISKLEQARKKYDDALNIAQSLNYLESKANQLKSFNYMKFAADNELIFGVMEQVEQYLIVSDVKGIYRKNLKTIDLILTNLYSMKEKMDIGVKPDVKSFWTILRLYSYNLLFGNYATSVVREAFKIN